MKSGGGEGSNDDLSEVSIVDEKPIPARHLSQTAKVLADLRDSAAINWQHKAKHIFSFVVIIVIAIFCIYLIATKTDEKILIFAMTLLSSIAGGAITYLFQERPTGKGR